MRTLALVSCLALSILACDERPQMTVDPNPVVANTTVWARFDRPIVGRAVDQYWIVIAPPGAPEGYQDGKIFVERSANGVQLEAPATMGEYEVRLHGDWPKRDYHVVRTAPLRVLPSPDVVGQR